MAETEFLSTRQAATRLGVSLGTVQNMVESGALEAWKTAGGHRRIPVSSVDSMLAQRKGCTGSTSEASGELDVLIAEDDPIMQRLYEATFQQWNLPIKLRLVANGFEGLLQVGQKKPDVLITDLMMPGMDGFEMIRQLHANPELADMDILVVSAIDSQQIAEGSLPASVNIFSKPIPFYEIKGFVLGRLAARQRKT